MQIDWLTVGAQIANFLILVALLRRFLYRPIIEAMARREERIAQQLRDAERREALAEASMREFQRKSDDLDRRRDELLARATDEAEAERRRRVEDARDELRREREHWRLQLEQEWEDVRKTIAHRLVGAVTASTRRALSELANTELEKAMITAFSHRLSQLDEAERAAAGSSAGPVEIATAFEPDEHAKVALSQSVRDALGREVRFVRADALVGGIELRATGWKLSWTIAEFLRGVEDEIAETIASASRQTTPH